MKTRTFGPTYDPVLDGERIYTQMERIQNYMLKIYPAWKTLAELETALGYPQASISAQLRHLKKRRFGGYSVEKNRRLRGHGGTWEYRVAEGKKEPSLFTTQKNGKTYLTKIRKDAIKDRIDNLIMLMEVPSISVIPVSRIKLELKNLKDCFNKLDTRN